MPGYWVCVQNYANTQKPCRSLQQTSRPSPLAKSLPTGSNSPFSHLTSPSVTDSANAGVWTTLNSSSALAKRANECEWLVSTHVHERERACNRVCLCVCVCVCVCVRVFRHSDLVQTGCMSFAFQQLLLTDQWLEKKTINNKLARYPKTANCCHPSVCITAVPAPRASQNYYTTKMLPHRKEWTDFHKWRVS